ncbi:MAG: enolase C-terminal domain-like protein [Candidatus Latescibacteria bacterium]|jgi:L-alanine-DL-glutamate epimerase-like enolase superfamily enzyme|nr:enolase C-terminal domain-like protein [Candidatus Latescibacterota bacterium]
MEITEVRFVCVKGSWDYDGPLFEERLVRPVDIYPEFRGEEARRSGMGLRGDPPYALREAFLFIDTDEGVSGMYGPVQATVARIIASQLSSILVGEHPHAVERIWDKMYRHAIHGRKGETMMAISAVDLALWDLKGKLLGAPVYELLGGPSRDRIRAYASMLGHSISPERVSERCREIVEQGYGATKWFFRHDPTEGEEGVRRNLELIRTVRESVGPDVEIMFDAWSSWNVPYTIRMAELAGEYRPWWFEEPVMADVIPQYAEIRRRVSTVSISGGEHEYTRWGIKSLLDAEAVDILQPDPTWAGGLTEMTKICALASSHGIPVIPHHGGIASTHLIASQALTTCPIQEWLIQHGARGQALLKPKTAPVDGHIHLPVGPGLGVELDEDVVESQEELSFA